MGILTIFKQLLLILTSLIRLSSIFTHTYKLHKQNTTPTTTRHWKFKFRNIKKSYVPTMNFPKHAKRPNCQRESTGLPAMPLSFPRQCAKELTAFNKRVLKRDG